MIRLVVEHSKQFREGYNSPREGIFWIIHDDIISYVLDPKSTSNFNYEHKNTWESIKNNYLINGEPVPFDYFPRGRVMVVERKTSEGTIDHYDAYIYLDDCINTKEIIDEIKYEFRLTSCNIKYIGSDGGITSNHYRCHNCSNS